MAEHTHAFAVEPPDGPTSQGSCLCGATREMRNSLPMDRKMGMTWKQDRTGLNLSRRQRQIVQDFQPVAYD